MVAVTQTIPNYIGGVSSQPDEKKSPGQVKDIINGYPDPSFGLGKRNGSQFLNILYEVSGEDELDSTPIRSVNISLASTVTTSPPPCTLRTAKATNHEPRQVLLHHRYPCPCERASG